ncbi:hypothetical protein SAMN05421847_0065 [Halpernia humi]|uniref:Uncharacterized protein n=1 Tax=Halpernia humi TaxID=493375 RepID=A0A1H5S7B8_9FLAO|nr:hypothetical protein [Halpernia humi]SEF46522.1 hypothetical protein SAMN05421847_0065 [Halpernia humi]
MKKYLLLIIGFIGFGFNAQNAKDYLNIPGPLEIDGTEFLLDWSKQKSATLYLQQYLPRDETIKTFTQLINISYFDKEIDLDDAVRQKVESFQNREKSDKYSNVQVTESPDGTQFIVDGILTETPKNGNPYAEYGIYRFKKMTNGAKKSFIIFSYIKRSYGDVKYAAKSLSKERNKLMGLLIDFQIPVISLATTDETKN